MSTAPNLLKCSRKACCGGNAVAYTRDLSNKPVCIRASAEDKNATRQGVKRTTSRRAF